MGHLINPIQFRLGYSLFYNKNWPALNKEQYMLCYNIQKDFTDYFKTLFGLRKKLVLKRRNRKRRLFTKVKHPRLIFSSCNVNFFGFNLHRVLVDVTLFDMRFESKWDSLFSRQYFENFIFQFGQVFRTTKILSQPSFFINIKKELLKKFFIILNKQYNLVNGTLISQTTKWVKSYLAKIYQKFFSFFNDSAYLVNKRRTLRKAKQYIKKRTKDQHVYITLKYKKVQKKKFIKNWSKIFLFLNPISSRLYLKTLKEKKHFIKIKKILLSKNKYLFNFSDLFDIYFKLITHKFAKKVRRRDLNRFHKLVESSKTNDYYKSIKNNIKYGLANIKLAKPIFSLIPLEDKIRLYKAQSHFFLKNIILKKSDVSYNRYNKLVPVTDLYKKFFKRFNLFRPYFIKLNQKINRSVFVKDFATKNIIQSEIKRFTFLVKLFFFFVKKYDIAVKLILKEFLSNMRSNILLRFPQKKSNKWYKWFFKSLILEVTHFYDFKNVKNKKFLTFLKPIFYVKSYNFKKIKVDDIYEKEEEIIEVTRKINKYPYIKYFRIQSKQSFIYKRLLINWIMRDGILLFEKLLANGIKIIQSDSFSLKRGINKYKSYLIKHIFKNNSIVNFKKVGLNKNIQNLFVPFSYNKENIIWNSLENKQNYYKNKLIIYNKIYCNSNYDTVFTEIQRSSKDHNKESEKIIRGSIKPLSSFNKYYRNQNLSETKVNLPVFGLNNDYKHIESDSILSNIDPFLSEKRANRDYYYKLDPFFQKYMKLQKIKSLQVNVNVDLGSKRMITAKFLSAWLKSLFKKGRKLTYVLRTLDRFIKPANNYIGAASVLFAGRFTRSAYTTYKYYRFGRLNSGEIYKQMDYSNIEFTTKFGMCGIKVKLQYKTNVFANRDLANYLKTAVLGSEIVPYKFNSDLHLPMLIKYGSKKLFRLNSKLDYKNNLPFYQFK